MSDTLQAAADELCNKHGLTGVGVAVARGDASPECAVAGVRRKGADDAIEVDDFWHLGSIGKSFTAVLAARLFQTDFPKLDATLPQVLPGVPMHEGWQSCTLHHLMTSSSGLAANFPLSILREREEDPEMLIELRRKFITAALAKAPKSPPGSKFRYSNLGYTLLGHIAETHTGVPYQQLLETEVLKPLGLEYGFSAPKGADQPWGHRVIFGFKKAVDPDNGVADNPAIIAPAGWLNMNLASMLKYGQAHLAGARGEHDLLDADTWRLLHTPFLDDYACGWVRAKHNGKGFEGEVYWHDGSNTLWYAMLILVPELNTVLALVTNHGAHRKAGQLFTLAAENLVEI